MMFDVVAMNWSLPLTCNLHEAIAFATWKSLKTKKRYRVMTELEHNAIRDPLSMSDNGFVNDPALNWSSSPLQRSDVSVC